MDPTADEVAGIVDLFGGLTRSELERALEEAAFRAGGETVDATALEGTIEGALESFALVRYERDDPGSEPLLVAGPTAFPTVPEHAADVPHILDVDRRRLDRDALGEAVSDRFTDAVSDAVEAGDDQRRRQLLEVSYDLEAWAPLDLTAQRRRLEETLE
ncbi:DUF7109 family protein [Halopiger djelfimassiliensis]|uniref:DUF7109 family protein n=1 Tax=Halopiger djelfimassiliensis TaxID=1293047 RepID=UPI000677678E|nr:hypothetical protein [Halopiger djelfimassiliensis]